MQLMLLAKYVLTPVLETMQTMGKEAVNLELEKKVGPVKVKILATERKIIFAIKMETNACFAQ
ncbi:MAG: hypothetical protein V4754_19485 [Pseudomonadota bacterium]